MPLPDPLGPRRIVRAPSLFSPRVITKGALTRMVWVAVVAQDAATAQRAAVAPSAASVRVKLDESEFRDLP
jgi:hypothetical protein